MIKATNFAVESRWMALNRIGARSERTNLLSAQIFKLHDYYRYVIAELWEEG